MAEKTARHAFCLAYIKFVVLSTTSPSGDPFEATSALLCKLQELGIKILLVQAQTIFLAQILANLKNL